ncbi:TPA: glycosyltransferase family 2 protein [Clostridium botulinum]|uniref:glycosyltransferase family 2 protein n=1 Tax=Clostridium TaxID=1485 RepID=UPI0007743619|nr:MULTISPECIES: glycosyltransferase family 2 protein [Clostridium]AUM96877.1 succinoglycan biosynthesis protein exoa [Clostridium sporogenes]AVQ54329.1 glycosyltransferase family 2 protein [Clostridium botulinum]HBJ2612094.1 glycosyltransferase family 2 protein [Clostridium botulinum]
MKLLKTVSVVIPCKNEKEYIKKCLDSFINQTYSNNLYEILVCDGMSEDGTREIIKEYNQKHDNIKLLDNLGISAPKGMNLGIRSSNSDIIIIFGAHAYAKENFIEENVKLLNNTEASCTGGPIETINDSDKGKAISLAMSSPFGVGNALFRYAKEEMYVDTVAFGAYEKKVLDKIGYFDEEMTRNQDDELNYRLTKSGFKILLSPKIKSWYYSRSSLKKLWKQYFQYGFWKVRVIQKLGKTPSIRHIVPMLFVLANTLGPILGIFIKPIFYLWLLEIGAYLVLDFILSIKLSNKKWSLFKYILLIFPILHIGYGIGFIEGIFSFSIFKSKNNVKKNSEITR